AKVDWKGYYQGEQRHRVVLPTYPFERQRYWVEAGGGKAAAATASSAAPLQKKPDVADWFYVPSWKRSGPPEVYCRDKGTRNFLIFNDECGVGSALASRLATLGHQAVIVTSSEQDSRIDTTTYTTRPSCAGD